MHYRPHHGVLTSCEFDHADIYPDFAAVQRAFRLYASLFPADGLLVAWGEDERVTDVLDACPGRVARYGFTAGAVPCQDPGRPLDIEIQLHGVGPQGADFSLFKGIAPPVHGRDPLPGFRGGALIGRFQSPMAGRHNCLNAAAALTIALDLGATVPQLQSAIAQFQGVKKRQEIRGIVGGVLVMDDYAHHPTAVLETVAAIRGQYPGQRLWAIFEAESNTSRRKVFETVYPAALAQADRVVLCQPLFKEGDKLTAEETMDAAAVCQRIVELGVPAQYIPAVSDIVDFVAKEARPGDVILAMSGRDFQGLHGALLTRLAGRFAGDR